MFKIALFLLLFISAPLLATPAHFDRTANNSLGLLSYKPIYIGTTAYYTERERASELMFQISFKYELSSEQPWYFAYTQTNFWSVQQNSAPMTNIMYAPELFYGWYIENPIVPYIQLGLYKHVSNGQDGNSSLTMNTSYIEPYFIINDEFILKLTYWKPFAFQSKDKVTDGRADMFDYYGIGEMTLMYTPDNGDQHTLTYREGEDKDIYAITYHWDASLNRIFGTGSGESSDSGLNPSIYVNFFNGYGETLATYNQLSTRMTLGISIIR